MGYSGAGGKLIHKKNQKQKISWHCPIKQSVILWPTLSFIFQTKYLEYCMFNTSPNHFHSKLSLVCLNFYKENLFKILLLVKII